METRGSGSGRGSDVIIAAGRAAIIIAVYMFGKAFQELSFELNQSSVALFVNKLSVIGNLMVGSLRPKFSGPPSFRPPALIQI